MAKALWAELKNSYLELVSILVKTKLLVPGWEKSKAVITTERLFGFLEERCYIRGSVLVPLLAG